MKKNYVQPKTKVVLVKMEHHLLNLSINDGQSGTSDLAKDEIIVNGKDDFDFGW